MKAQLVPAAILPALALTLAGCGERNPDLNAQGATTPPYVRAETDRSTLGEAVTPVRIGEMGSGFAACNARGTLRERPGGSVVPVRAAPFDASRQVDEISMGAQFYICSRSHDQRWFGIVYDESGTAADRCGVGVPVAARRDYDGPCAAGWVPSTLVRLVSGVPPQLPAE